MINEEKTINKQIGKKIRDRRKELSISQTSLANLLGVTFQQIQKYETASNRISAAKLKIVCKIFNVSSKYFY